MAREMPIKHAQGFLLFVILLFVLDDVTENDVSQMLAFYWGFCSFIFIVIYFFAELIIYTCSSQEGRVKLYGVCGSKSWQQIMAAASYSPFLLVSSRLGKLA